MLVTILVHNPKAAKGEKAKIHYHDIGDYLKREQKLAILKEKRSILSRGIQWQEITPDAHGDWLTQRSGIFESFILLGDKKDKSAKETFFAPVYSNGLKTQRDAWCYNYSKPKLEENIRNAIDFYNEQCDSVKNGKPMTVRLTSKKNVQNLTKMYYKNSSQVLVTQGDFDMSFHNTLFSQTLSLIPRHIFQKLEHRHKTGRSHVDLDSRNSSQQWLLSNSLQDAPCGMVFGVWLLLENVSIIGG